jgi:hypothetical protein
MHFTEKMCIFKNSELLNAAAFNIFSTLVDCYVHISIKKKKIAFKTTIGYWQVFLP